MLCGYDLRFPVDINLKTLKKEHFEVRQSSSFNRKIARINVRIKKKKLKPKIFQL